MPRKSLDAVRTNIYLPRKQDEALRNLSDHSGITFAEHLRRAVDFYLAFSDDIQKTVDRLAGAETITDPSPPVVEPETPPEMPAPRFKTTVEG